MSPKTKNAFLARPKNKKEKPQKTIETIKTLFAEIRAKYHHLKPYLPRLNAGYIALCYAKDIFSWAEEREAYLTQIRKEVFGTRTEEINIAEATTNHLIKTETLKKKCGNLNAL